MRFMLEPEFPAEPLLKRYLSRNGAASIRMVPVFPRSTPVASAMSFTTASLSSSSRLISSPWELADRDGARVSSVRVPRTALTPEALMPEAAASA